MATEQSTRADRHVAESEPGATLELEHLSVLPVTGAAAAVVSGAEWAWPVAAMLLAVAYLGAYAASRR